MRAIGVAHTARKDEFRRNLRSHSWGVSSFLYHIFMSEYEKVYAANIQQGRGFQMRLATFRLHKIYPLRVCLLYYFFYDLLKTANIVFTSAWWAARFVKADCWSVIYTLHLTHAGVLKSFTFGGFYAADSRVRTYENISWVASTGLPLLSDAPNVGIHTRSCCRFRKP